MSEIKPCPEIEMVENLRYSWKYGLFKAVGDDKHVSDQAAADMIEALTASLNRASDACASVQRERDEAREMLGNGVRLIERAVINTPDQYKSWHASAKAFLSRYEGEVK